MNFVQTSFLTFKISLTIKINKIKLTFFILFKLETKNILELCENRLKYTQKELKDKDDIMIEPHILVTRITQN